LKYQDAAARFTLDSATEFLFGKDVGSLSAGLPYPPNSNISNSASFFEHPSNQFVQAFAETQEWAVSRTRHGRRWRLYEFWKDEVIERRKIMDAFVTPIVKEAIVQRQSLSGEKVAQEETNFLSNLVDATQGMVILLSL
jgi:hypothetical protein